MCGIGGALAFGKTRVNKDGLHRMTDAQKHRGPDAEGLYINPDEKLGLIHNRLSIIDLEGGVQPMRSTDESTVIAFNGEIYGFQELKNQIKDYPYRTKSDTEVILAMYAKYGEAFLKHLPGMFAIALWDEKNNTLILARDRFGEKPLYYFMDHEKLVFSSELKGIKAYFERKLEIDKSQLSYYLRKGFIHPHQSIYKGIYQVPPACYLKFSEKGFSELVTYWDLPGKNNNLSFKEATQVFHELFQAAVEKQMVSDVPVSAFLSGGMDSSTVVIEAAKKQPNIQTLSFRFEGDVDETPYSSLIADTFKLKNQIISLDMKSKNPEEIFRKLVNIYDQPFADTSALPTYLICKKAAEYGKVALTGDGGDELLAGYPWYQTIRRISQTEKIAEFEFLFRRLWYKSSQLFSKTHNRQKIERLMMQDLIRRYPEFTLYYQEFNNYFSPLQLNDLLQDIPNINTSLYTWGDSWIDHQTQADYAEYLPGGILVKTDRAAMANSLELRAPFLDVDLVNFVLSLPSEFKIDANSDKKLLRSSYKSYIPKEVIQRKKQGFGMPLHQVFDSKAFKSLKAELFQNPNRKVFDLINFENSQHYVKEDNQQLYTLLMLGLWAEEFL